MRHIIAKLAQVDWHIRMILPYRGCARRSNAQKDKSKCSTGPQHLHIIPMLRGCSYSAISHEGRQPYNYSSSSESCSPIGSLRVWWNLRPENGMGEGGVCVLGGEEGGGSVSPLCVVSSRRSTRASICNCDKNAFGVVIASDKILALVSSRVARK